MRKVDAVVEVLKKYGGSATWPQIYSGIEEFYPAAKVSKFWEEGIRGVVYREIRAGAKSKLEKMGTGVIKLKVQSCGCEPGVFACREHAHNHKE